MTKEFHSRNFPIHVLRSLTSTFMGIFECLGKYVHYKALLLCKTADLQTKSFLCVLFSFYEEFSLEVYESIWSSHCIIVSEFHIIGPWHATPTNRVLIE